MNRKCRERCLSLLFAALVMASGEAMARDLIGAGEWQSVNGESMRGSWNLELTQSGEAIRGVLNLRGSNIVQSAQVLGTISEDQIAIGTVKDGESAISFTGKRSGTSIEGEWSFTTLGDNGVWYGKLTEKESELRSMR